jgi:hypothetical protein
MVTKLNYASKYDKALRYIFGKTLICRNLEVATNLAKTSGLDCVTLEGDQVCLLSSIIIITCSVMWRSFTVTVSDLVVTSLKYICVCGCFTAGRRLCFVK